MTELMSFIIALISEKEGKSTFRWSNFKSFCLRDKEFDDNKGNKRLN